MTLLIFDCDGVLVDSERLACEVDAEFLTRLGFPITAGTIAQRFIGASLRDMIGQIEAEHGRPLPPGFGPELTRLLLARFETDLQPIAGVGDAIRALPYPRCVASSSTPDRIAYSLRLTGLDKLFARLFSAVEVPRGKPAPDLFLYAAAEMDARPAECIVIEDSTLGVQGARAAGMAVIGFTGGGHCGPDHARKLAQAGATAVIEHMSDLASAVDDLVTHRPVLER
jgi:HAD superfamily hydrolase (TIGR01509 family)